MTREEAKSCIGTIEMLQRLAYNIHGVMDVIDADNCKKIIKALEQEPCDDVCEWFEQYVDIATDIVELRFSDGTVKRAKRGLYMRDIEKSIRKMLIDQISNEKKQELKWIPVSERLPEKDDLYLVCFYDGEYDLVYFCKGKGFSYTGVIAWMPLPKPYKPTD